MIVLKLSLLTFLFLGFSTHTLGQGTARSLPEAFSTYISVYFGESKVLDEILLNYDKEKNKGSIYLKIGQVFVYNFADDEFLAIRGSSCQAEKIPRDNSYFFFPFNNLDEGGLQLASPDVAFHMDGDHRVVSKNESLDGISAEHWTSNKSMVFEETHWNCAFDHWFENDAEIFVTPLKIEFKCVFSDQQPEGTEEPIVKTFYHDYRFFRFDPEKPKDEAFQQPLGIYCLGKNSTTKKPKLPSRFRFEGESLIPDITNLEAIAREQIHYWYDSDFKLVRFDQYSNENELRITSLYDFGKGVIYELANGISDVSQKCSVITMYDTTMPSADETLWRQKIPGDYQYVGQRVHNGITYYIWAASSTQDPNVENFEVRNVYYVKEMEPREGNFYRYIPSHQETYTIKEGNLETVSKESLFGYRISPSDWSTLDVTACFYKPGQVIYFQIDILSQDRKPITTNLVSLFKEGLHGELLGAMGISPARLNKMQIVYFEDGDVWATAAITENPSLLGFGITNTEPPVSEAFTRLQKQVNFGKFVFSITDPTSKQEYKYKAMSSEQIESGGGTLFRPKKHRSKKLLHF